MDTNQRPINLAHLKPNEIEALHHAIRHRRSLGLARIKSDPVPRELIEEILEAANWAPSHRDFEPWRFAVIMGDGRAGLADAFASAYRSDAGTDYRADSEDAYRSRAWLAPVWISIGMEPGRGLDGELVNPEEDIMAVACAMQNLHLVAAAYGLAGMWHSKGTSTHPAVAEYLGITPPGRLLGMFFCGWPNIRWPQGERRPWQSKVRWFESR